MVAHLKSAPPEEARSLVRHIIAENSTALIWARLFMAGANQPETLGAELWRYATLEVFQRSPDTRKDAIDLVAARYKFEQSESREKFERAVLSYDFSQSDDSDARRKVFLERIFGSIGDAELVTQEAKEVLSTAQLAGVGPAPNVRPFQVHVTGGKPEKWWWLKRMGVDVAAPNNLPLLKQVDDVKARLGLEQGSSEVQISADIDGGSSRLKALATFLSAVLNRFPDKVETLAAGVISNAQGRGDGALEPVLEGMGNILALLWALHGRSGAFDTLAGWVSESVTFSTGLSHALFAIRDGLVIGLESETADEEKIRKRCHQLAFLVVDRVGQDLTELLSLPADDQQAAKGKQAQVYAQLALRSGRLVPIIAAPAASRPESPR